MHRIQEKRRGGKRAAKDADSTLPPAKRGRPSKPTGIRGRLSAERAVLEKKLTSLRRTPSFRQTPKRIAASDDDADDDDDGDQKDEEEQEEQERDESDEEEEEE
jgi:hypothetical protein